MPKHNEIVTLAGLASFLKGEVNGNWINIPGPGHSKSDRSLGVRFDSTAPNGFALNSFAGDHEKECRSHVLQLLSNVVLDNTSLNTPAEASIEKEAEVEKLKHARSIWLASSPLAGTAAERYLVGRGCSAFHAAKINGVLKFNPHCQFAAKIAPAMVAKMESIFTSEFRGIHRTAIELDGSGKFSFPGQIRSKMMLGRATGSAVKLFPCASIMGIAEGIETALSAAIVSKLPVWALLSANGVKQFPVIPEVKHLIIFADNDDTGIRAATTCAQCHHYAGVVVTVQIPPAPFKDWNDFLKGKGK